jgi:hypothetical protein
MNVLPCELSTASGRPRAQIGAHEVDLPPSIDAAALASSTIELGIRPEHIAVLDPPPYRDAGSQSALAVTVTAVEDHGRFRIIAGWFASKPGDAAAGGDGQQRIKIRLDAAGGDPALAAGATIHVRFPPQHVCLYSDHKIVASGAATTAGGAP